MPNGCAKEEDSSSQKTVISDNVGSIETYFQLKTADAKDILQWCMNQGLIASGYHCPKCTKPMVLSPRIDNCDKFTWVCRNKGQNAHHVKKSVRTGSWFEKSHLPIPTILLYLIYWCLEMKSKFIMEQLDIAQKTASDWASLCREVSLDILITQLDKIGGSDVVVEIYESKFGERRFHHGKGVSGEWVIFGVERGTNNCFFAVVENRTIEVLLSVIKKHILKGTTIISDCWKSYDLNDLGNLIDNLGMRFVAPSAETHKNSIEYMWGNIKRNLRSTNHAQGCFDSYLAVHVWRRINPSVESRMRSLIGFIKEGYPLRIEAVLSLSRGKNGNRPRCSPNAGLDVLSPKKKKLKELNCSISIKQEIP